MGSSRPRAEPASTTTLQEEVDDTPAEHRPGTTRPGRHRRGRGRHAASTRPFRTTHAVAKAVLALAIATLVAAVTTVGFPRATSNASVGRIHAAEAINLRAVAAVTAAATGEGKRICPIDWRRSTWHVKRLIRCAAEHFDVSRRKALYIAWRESRYQPDAYNRAGRAAGIYQHLLKYWPDRADSYGFAAWSPFNARANIFVTMRVVRDHGWAPWAL